MRLVFALLLLAAAGPVAPQAPKADPSEERPAVSPSSPAPRLNLKLDDPARYTREAPRESDGAAGALPTLGANARPVPVTPMPTTTRPFPEDTERRQR